MIKDIMGHEFDMYVINARKRLVMVDFWAEWCGPCKTMTPILEQLSHTHESALDILKMNVDDNPDLSKGFGIRSIPTLIVFSGGKEIKRIIGAVSYNTLIDEIATL